MSTLEEKRAEFEKVARELRALEEKIRLEEAYPKAKEQEDKYWKYRNSYSCPEKESDYWYIYRHVLEVRPDGIMIVDEFQTDRYGKSTIECGKEESWTCGNLEWIQSTRAEFYSAALDLAGRVSPITG